MHTQSQSGVSGNIWKLYVLLILSNALFSICIITYFFRSFGLNMEEIFMLQSAFGLAIVFFEIPSGYLADRWGRKQTIIAGCVLDVVGYVIYANSTGFWSILVAEVLLGIGFSLHSGTIEAMTYDTLLVTGEELSQPHVTSRQYYFMSNSEAICSVIGGFLAMISLSTAIGCTVIPLVIGLFVACTLVEPKRVKMVGESHARELWKIGMNTFVRNEGLRSVILVYALISVMTLMIFWFMQPYLEILEAPMLAYGLVHALSVLSGGFASKHAEKIWLRTDNRGMFQLIAVIIVTCFLVLGLPPGWWGLVFFFIGRMAWSLLRPITSYALNNMAESDVRATVLSMSSFPGRLIFFVLSQRLGAAADTHGIPFALMSGGVVGGFLLICAFFLIRNVWPKIPKYVPKVPK